MSQELTIVDGCNPSNWDSPEVFANLARGGVSAVNVTTAVWEGFSEAVDVTGRWIRRFREEDQPILQVKTVDDIARAKETGRVGIILGWQNISPVENDFERLEAFHAMGVRVAQLAYNYRNLAANGCYERRDDGLSIFGQMTVRKMNELGILVDLSHVGDISSMDAIEHSTSPVAFTHCNIREFMDHPRNKPSDLVRALVDKGGVIGANQFPRFLPHGFESTLDDFLDAIESTLEVAGIDHVGIATDFCEGQDMDYWRYLRRIHNRIPYGEPEVPRPDPTVSGLRDATELPKVVDGLVARGFSPTELAKIMGGNWIRLYGDVWR